LGNILIEQQSRLSTNASDERQYVRITGSGNFENRDVLKMQIMRKTMQNNAYR